MLPVDVTNEFFKAASFTGVLMTDGDGVIVHVDDNFESNYGMDADFLLGKTVYELEEKNYFKPSAAAIVLKTGKDITTIQSLRDGQQVIISAFPTWDEKGNISQVVTFTRDIDQYIKIKNLYEKLAEQIEHYDRMVKKLSYDTEPLDNYSTNNEAFRQTLKSVRSTAKYNVNMLILGETGVGKTLLAQKIHEISGHKDGEFIEVNCSALPGTLIESELFGYEKGAFTGADQQGKRGLFEVAKDGTLFLDEISELSQKSQAKLLKVLQDGEFRRIGGNRNIKTNCRIISATNKDLAQEVERDRFRRDLYYRLNTVTFTVPPLRERREDILLLCDALLKKANLKFNQNKILDKSVMKIFLKYDWPGNVRELENAMYRMVITSDDNVITSSAIPKEIMEMTQSKEGGATPAGKGITDLAKAMEAYEGEIIRQAYLEHRTSCRVAQALGISQATAARKIRKYVK